MYQLGRDDEHGDAELGQARRDVLVRAVEQRAVQRVDLDERVERLDARQRTGGTLQVALQ